MRRLVLMLGALLSIFILGSATASAETGKKALILSSSVSGGALSPEASRATADGFALTLVTDPQWLAMTTAQFSDYQLIVVGDPTCGFLPQVVSQNAAALAGAVMGGGTNTKAGNRVLIGTDPVFHRGGRPGANTLINDAIDFAGVQEGASGLYLDFTCGDPDYDVNGQRDGLQKLLPLLTIDTTPGWSENSGPPCGGSASLISNAAQFSTLHSSDLQGWSCSVHESFPTFPSDWSPLAIATDTPTHPTCGSDVDTGAAQCGEAYLLIAGSGIVSEAPNLSLDPPTATNPVGTTHTVTATVTNPNGSPRSGVHVEFVVTGANAGATVTCDPASCNTGADGKVKGTWTGANEGDDTVNATIEVDGSRQSATAKKTWVKSASGGVMTGEGRLTDGTKKLDYAYILDCNSSLNSPAKFKGKLNTSNFNVSSTSAVSCTDDPSKTPATAAAFDTMEGEGHGTVGSTPVTVTFKFVDGGTAGTNDSSCITITNTATSAVLFSKCEAPIGAYGGGTRPGRNTANPPGAI